MKVVGRSMSINEMSNRIIGANKKLRYRAAKKMFNQVKRSK